MSLVERVRRRFARAPEPVRAVVDASADPDERVLAWGELAGGGWLVATSLGLRTVAPDGSEDGGVLRWHEVGAARWKAVDGGGSFVVTPLAEVEPGVQARRPTCGTCSPTPGNCPAWCGGGWTRRWWPASARRCPAAGRCCWWPGGCPARPHGSGPSSSTTTSSGRPGGPGGGAGEAGRAVAAEPPPEPDLRGGQRGVPLPILERTRGDDVVGTGLGHAGDALQARVVLGVLPGATDLLVALPAGPRAQDVAGAEAGEEGQLRHDEPPGGRPEPDGVTLPVRAPRRARAGPAGARPAVGYPRPASGSHPPIPRSSIGRACDC